MQRTPITNVDSEPVPRCHVLFCPWLSAHRDFDSCLSFGMQQQPMMRSLYALCIFRIGPSDCLLPVHELPLHPPKLHCGQVAPPFIRRNMAQCPHSIFLLKGYLPVAEEAATRFRHTQQRAQVRKPCRGLSRPSQYIPNRRPTWGAAIESVIVTIPTEHRAKIMINISKNLASVNPENRGISWHLTWQCHSQPSISLSNPHNAVTLSRRRHGFESR